MKDHVALHLWMTTILISRGKMSSLFALLDRMEMSSSGVL